MDKYSQCVRIIAIILLTSLYGCSDWNQANVLTGHFFMRTTAGTILLYLGPDNKSEETLIPKHGSAETIHGQWKLEGSYLALTPFVDWGLTSSQVAHDSWRALPQYDHKNNLELLIYEDRGAYFERQHPLSLAMLQGSIY